LRILLHDYSGHPFQVELSRELARRGHVVRHLYSSAIQSPRGRLQRGADDPAGLTIEGVGIGGAIDKYGFVRRWFQERRYAAKLAARIAAFAPDAIISANAPPHVQRAAQRAARAGGARFVFWLQDLYGEAARRLLPRRLKLAGRLAAHWLTTTEAACLRRSDAVVAITGDFVPLLRGYGVSPARIAVIENWSPLDEIAPRPKDNPWSRRHGLSGTTNLLYAGTLGLKHNPGLLAALAAAVADRPETRLVVASEGLGADHLAAAKRDGRLDRLVLLPFQDFADLPDMLGAADVVLALLEADAGVFSVPSKVLTYLAAGRPIIGAMPRANLAARLIEREQAGLVVAPHDQAGFVDACRRLLDDAARRHAMGANGRAYAERAFAVGPIADRFLALLEPAQNQVANRNARR
jgi:glycosyltransferase involved in cell wall biosynthesis